MLKLDNRDFRKRQGFRYRGKYNRANNNKVQCRVLVGLDESRMKSREGRGYYLSTSPHLLYLESPFIWLPSHVRITYDLPNHHCWLRTVICSSSHPTCMIWRYVPSPASRWSISSGHASWSAYNWLGFSFLLARYLHHRTLRPTAYFARLYASKTRRKFPTWPACRVHLHMQGLRMLHTLLFIYQRLFLLRLHPAVPASLTPVFEVIPTVQGTRRFPHAQTPLAQPPYLSFCRLF